MKIELSVSFNDKVIYLLIYIVSILLLLFFNFVGKTYLYILKVHEVEVEVGEGDARNVLCDAVDRHHASILIMGSHGYGKLKRYLHKT